MKNVITIAKHAIDENLKDKKLDIYDTIIHECTHAEQYYKMEDACRIKTYKDYSMIKEEYISEFCPMYYKENYEKMHIELDAEEQAAQKTAGFIERMNPTAREDRDNIALAAFDIEESIKNLRKEKEYFDEKAKYQKHLFKISGMKKSVTKKLFSKNKKTVKNMHTIAGLFDTIVSPDMIKKHPILRIEYHDDGYLKTPSEIFSDFIKEGDYSDERCQFIREILFNGCSFNKRHIGKQLNELLQVYSSIPESEPKIKELFSLIISDNTEKILFNTKKISKSQKKEFDKLKNTLESIESPDFIRGIMNSSVPDHKPIITVLKNIHPELANLINQQSKKYEKVNEVFREEQKIEYMIPDEFWKRVKNKNDEINKGKEEKDKRIIKNKMEEHIGAYNRIRKFLNKNLIYRWARKSEVVLENTNAKEILKELEKENTYVRGGE